MWIYYFRLVRSFSHLCSNPSQKAHFVYCALPNKSFLSIRGPDTVKFLNGLVTSKLSPNFVKKNLTTISFNSNEPLQDVGQFDMRKGNWGIYKEGSKAGGAFISRFGTYSAILNNKGKLIYDIIIFPIPLNFQDSQIDKTYPEYLIQCDSSVADRLTELLSTYKLLQKVKITRLYGLKSWHASINTHIYPERDNDFSFQHEFWNSMTSTYDPDQAAQFSHCFVDQFFPGSGSKLLAAFNDTRNVNNSNKSSIFYFVTKEDTQDLGELFKPQMIKSETIFSRSTPKEVATQRMLRAVLEGADEIPPEKLIPMELNFQLFEDTLSFDKGCYVGQELTTRIHSTGVIRKRCVPIIIENPLSSENSGLKDIFTDSEFYKQTYNTALSPFGTMKLNKPRDIKIGKLLHAVDQNGVALIKLEYIERAREKNNFKCYYIDPQTKLKTYLHIKNQS